MVAYLSESPKSVALKLVLFGGTSPLGSWKDAAAYGMVPVKMWQGEQWECSKCSGCSHTGNVDGTKAVSGLLEAAQILLYLQRALLQCRQRHLVQAEFPVQHVCLDHLLIRMILFPHEYGPDRLGEAHVFEGSVKMRQFVG